MSLYKPYNFESNSTNPVQSFNMYTNNAYNTPTEA